jgi:glycosyltransferase involved in cell wall biosynthesis
MGFSQLQRNAGNGSIMVATHPSFSATATDSRPHVVHVIDELPPDGAERLIVDILQNACGEFRYSVLCIVRGGPLAEELQAMGIPVAVLGRRPGLDPGTPWALVRWFRRHDVKVAHTHLYAADSYGRLAAWIARVPGRFSTRHSINAWDSGLRRWLAKALSATSDKVIACGDEVGRALVEREGLPPCRVVVVPNGINLHRLEGMDPAAFRQELRLPAQRLLIGIVGRLHHLKGHTVLLHALSSLRSNGCEFHCVVVGSGDLASEIAQQIEHLGLRACVTLLGQRRDVPRILAALDILAMPSLCEGLPMALLEGMALGNAVVATHVGSIPNVITDGENGLLVPPGDAESMHRALVRLAQDPALRQQLGSKARNTVRSRFSAAATVAAYERLYRKALAQTGGGASA